MTTQLQIVYMTSVI